MSGGGGGDGGARIPSRGGVVILSVASRYGNRVKLRQMSHLACDDFTFTLRQGFYDSNQTLNNAKEKKERESRGKGKKIGNTHLADLRKKKENKAWRTMSVPSTEPRRFLLHLFQNLYFLLNHTSSLHKQKRVSL